MRDKELRKELQEQGLLHSFTLRPECKTPAQFLQWSRTRENIPDHKELVTKHRELEKKFKALLELLGVEDIGPQSKRCLRKGNKEVEI